MKPYRDESDEDESSVQVAEEESVSEYWGCEKEEESAALQPGGTQNILLYASHGHEGHFQPRIPAKQLQVTGSHVQSDAGTPMELPRTLPDRVVTAAGPIAPCTKNNTPKNEQRCTGFHHPFYESIAERRRKRAPFVSHRLRNGNPYGVVMLT